MTARAYYNEREPYAAQWLRNLSDAGLICPGDVDERDIRDVVPADIAGYTQHHFFAGIGVWSLALRLAGWPDDRPVFTGSCPCQPFSAAGRGVGFADERHLWPHWFHIIRCLGPSEVFGEQVASDDGLGWLDLVSSDMEGEGYALGAADLCVAGFGAPHIRQRLFFVGARGLADADDDRRYPSSESEFHDEEYHPQSRGDAGRLVDASIARLEGCALGASGAQRAAVERTSPRNPWADCEWVPCRDPRRGLVWRPTEPGTFPLAYGAPSRVGRLRAYGNAISPYPAAEIIKAYLEIETAIRRDQN